MDITHTGKRAPIAYPNRFESVSAHTGLSNSKFEAALALCRFFCSGANASAALS
jgi:hypothetical protein